MTHRATVDFLLYDWLNAESLCRRERHTEHNRETFTAVLDLSEKIALEQFAPINRLTDVHEPEFDGVTVTLTNISSHKRQKQELRQALTALEVQMGERKNLQDELTRMATTDPLTGALNRRELMQRSKQEVAAARRYGRSLSLLIADIDFFKKLNDTYGHGVGDIAIRMVADICQQALRETDLVARIGGEEYVILMPEASGERAAETADRLRKTIAAATIPADGSSFSITASFGVTEWSPEDDSIETTLARADSALYDAKQAGRNRVELHMPDTQLTAVVDEAGVSADRQPSGGLQSTIRH